MLVPPRAGPVLDRSIDLPRATAMVVGTILGAAIFVQASEIGRHVPSISGMLLVWLGSGLLTWCGASVCAELASTFPQTGGVYVFLKEIFSPVMGFLWGWAMFWSVHSGIVAAIAVIFARYVAHFAPFGDGGVRAVAIAGILALSATNYFGVRQGSTVQAAFTLAKVLAVVVLLVLFFASDAPRYPAAEAAATAAATINLGEFLLALSAGLFAFGGWHMVTYAAGETRAPERTIPRALMLGTLIVTACYVGLNAAYLRVLPLPRVLASTRVAAEAADAVLGSWGGAMVSGLVIVSTFGALSGIVLAGPRVYWAMAQDGLAFRWMGALHPRYRTPHAAIFAQALWSSALVLTDTYRGLFMRVVYTEWLFFALLAIGLFRLRRRAGYAPACRTWGYPLVPALFVASSLLIALQQIASSPLASAAALALVAAGLPVYHYWKRQAAGKGAMPVAHY